MLLESSWNVMAHGDAQVGEVKGKLANWVGGQYPSHYIGTRCIQHYYRWCTHLGCQQSTELTSPPADLNWLVRLPKDRIWFLRVCHHISTGLYLRYAVTDLISFVLFGVAGALEEECESQGREKDQHLNGKQRHQLKHRELFLSRQVETLPATHIRGKCSVTLLNETESLLSYLNKDVRFIFFLQFL